MVIMRSGLVVTVIIVIAIIVGILLSLPSWTGRKELDLAPREKIREEASRATPGTEVGTGWSVKENPEDAVKEAVRMALRGKTDKTPDFAIIFGSSDSDMEAILSEARALFGAETKIYGGTSSSGEVMTDKGLAEVTDVSDSSDSLMEGKRSLAVMTVTSEDIVFGVGSADYSDYPAVKEASKAAVLGAMKNAGKSSNEMPKAILITPISGNEEQLIEGIEEVVGKNTPLLGGGGSRRGISAASGDDKVHKKGISLAVIYTDLPVGWIFEGGFDVGDSNTGIITRHEGQTILEIDNRPALDLYDEWLGGEVKRLCEKGDSEALRSLRILNPIYKRYTSPSRQTYSLFVVSSPVVETGALKVAFNVEDGDRIYLGHGAWETLLNRIGNLPRKAKITGGIGAETGIVLGIGYVCIGVMNVIPEAEREKAPLLIKYANDNAPFLVTFTVGEQGHFPGVGNKHGHLLTSFLVIGNKQ